MKTRSVSENAQHTTTSMRNRIRRIMFSKFRGVFYFCPSSNVKLANNLFTRNGVLQKNQYLIWSFFAIMYCVFIVTSSAKISQFVIFIFNLNETEKCQYYNIYN